MRSSQAGLGARGADYGSYVSDSRRETMSRIVSLVAEAMQSCDTT